jgi:hypothetical protein
MPPVDITFTVKASVANGRRLMKNDDGSTFWEGDEPVPEIAPVIEQAMKEEEKVVKPRAKKRLIHG